MGDRDFQASELRVKPGPGCFPLGPFTLHCCQLLTKSLIPPWANDLCREQSKILSKCILLTWAQPCWRLQASRLQCFPHITRLKRSGRASFPRGSECARLWKTDRCVQRLPTAASSSRMFTIGTAPCRNSLLRLATPSLPALPHAAPNKPPAKVPGSDTWSQLPTMSVWLSFLHSSSCVFVLYPTADPSQGSRTQAARVAVHLPDLSFIYRHTGDQGFNIPDG